MTKLVIGKKYHSTANDLNVPNFCQKHILSKGSKVDLLRRYKTIKDECAMKSKEISLNASTICVFCYVLAKFSINQGSMKYTVINLILAKTELSTVST